MIPWKPLWKYKNIIGLGLLLVGAIIIFGLYRHSLIQHGKDLYETMYNNLIGDAQNKSAEVIKENEKEYVEIIKYIETKPREINPVLPNWSDTVIRLHDNKGDNR